MSDFIKLPFTYPVLTSPVPTGPKLPITSYRTSRVWLDGEIEDTPQMREAQRRVAEAMLKRQRLLEYLAFQGYDDLVSLLVQKS